MSSSGRGNAFKSAIRRLAPSKPLLRDWRFWAVQVIVVGLAILHDILEGAGFKAALGNLCFLPASLFWMPVIYAALTFGFAGSFATALLVLVASVPNFIFWHVGTARLWEISEVSIMVTTALIVGYLVDQKRIAYQTAKLYANHALRAQEQERQQISRDLHDGTIQSLVVVCQQIDSIRYFSTALPSSLNEELLAIRHSVAQIVDGLRDFTKALRPPILDDLGLEASIRQLLTNLTERTGINAELEVVGEERQLPAEKETGMFRIAQEALRNVERHAKATKVTATITLTNTEAVLDILDNGVGFVVPRSRNDFASAGKLGLLTMVERAELLGGRLKIESRPVRGTRVIASVPLKA